MFVSPSFTSRYPSRVKIPRAYHITWGVYGARLHGSSSPHVDREHNQYGTPFAPSDPVRHQLSRDRMKFDPLCLTLEQRKCVEETLFDLAARYTWRIHALAAQSDHVHVVITAPREGRLLRDALKATASRKLNKQYGSRPWWAENGSCKYLWEEWYFKNATDYVLRQREF